MLLEVETDKAQMDVEAQDDGIMAKITVNHRLQSSGGMAVANSASSKAMEPKPSKSEFG